MSIVSPRKRELMQEYSLEPESKRNWPVPLELDNGLWVIQFLFQFANHVVLEQYQRDWQSLMSKRLFEICFSRLDSSSVDDNQSYSNFKIKTSISNVYQNYVSMFFVTSENPISQVFFPAYAFLFENLSIEFKSSLDLIQGQPKELWMNPRLSRM